MVKKGPWTAEEDMLLTTYIKAHGVGHWRTLPKKAGLQRCGKGCRLRWMNYLRPNVKRGNISLEEEELIIRLHKLLGNRWSLIAGRVPGRTDNEIKNYWNTRLSKKLRTSNQPDNSFSSSSSAQRQMPTTSSCKPSDPNKSPEKPTPQMQSEFVTEDELLCHKEAVNQQWQNLYEIPEVPSTEQVPVSHQTPLSQDLDLDLDLDMLWSNNGINPFWVSDPAYSGLILQQFQSEESFSTMQHQQHHHPHAIDVPYNCLNPYSVSLLPEEFLRSQEAGKNNGVVQDQECHLQNPSSAWPAYGFFMA